MILGLNDKVVVGDSYAQALSELFRKSFDDTTVTATTTTNVGSKRGSPVGQSVSVSDERKALEMMDQAETALKKGDLSQYAELQKQAKKQLERLVSASQSRQTQ